MFVGLQRSEVMAKPSFLLSPTGVQRMQRKITGEKHQKDAKQTLSGFSTA